jgi:hypothetical protein
MQTFGNVPDLQAHGRNGTHAGRQLVTLRLMRDSDHTWQTRAHRGRLSIERSDHVWSILAVLTQQYEAVNRGKWLGWLEQGAIGIAGPTDERCIGLTNRIRKTYWA